jgi:hypothetical protein
MSGRSGTPGRRCATRADSRAASWLPIRRAQHRRRSAPYVPQIHRRLRLCRRVRRLDARRRLLRLTFTVVPQSANV